MKQGFWNKFIRRIAACLTAGLMLFAMLSGPLASVFAWISDNGMSSPIDITSNVHKTYFESGDGTDKTPYVIAEPLQLYYFAWLQNLGLFNIDGEDEDTDVDTVYFVLANDIDMTGYPLPPAGTTKYPFLGNFDGNGKKISNLTVENEKDHLFEPPEGAEALDGYTEIIGFFGVVGALPQAEYTYKSSINVIKNLLIEDITIATHTDNALVGFVAGYANGIIDCVGVSGGTIKLASEKAPNPITTYTGNISDYSLIGYCTPECKNAVYVIGSSISAPGTTDMYTVVLNNSNDGEGQGWGGSVKMSDIYTWLTAIKNRNNNTNENYIVERKDIIDLSGKTVTAATEVESRKAVTVDGFGGFVFGTNTTNYVNFVSGAQKVTEYIYEYATTEAPENVYYIKDGDEYLNFYGNGITSNTEESNTQWYALTNGAGSGAIYTVLNDTIYYLTITNNALGVISYYDVDPANLPVWEYANGRLSFDEMPIECENGTWQIAATTQYKISYDNNYLHTTNGTSITSTTNQNTAATWSIEAVNGGYTVSTVIGNTEYFLVNDGNSNVTLSTTATTWTYSTNNNTLSVRAGNSTRYLRYRNGWSLSSNQYSLTFTPVYDREFDIETVLAGTDTKILVTPSREYIDTSLTNGYYDESGTWTTTGSKDDNIDRTAGITYFPLSTTVNGTNYQIDPNNTGYIVGAEWSTTTYNQQDGIPSNLRISSYSNNSVPNEAEAGNPYTISYKTKNDEGTYQFKKIFDSVPTDAEALTTAEKEKISSLGLQKFAGCYEKYLSSVLDGSWEGLHFMNAPISMNNLTTITASLSSSKEPIEGYEVPTNSIDFNLYDKGFINVIAGSYYTQGNGNNSIFSIYQIERYEDGKRIKSIQELYKVYAKMDGDEIDTNEAYHYTYVGYNGNTRVEVGKENIPAGYEMVFDCDWITHSSNYTGWANSRAYYFEVPVNAGEYAIGSTQGRTGAYLVYLDLAANAQLLNRVQEHETIVENQTQASIPKGVEILTKDEAALFDPTSDPKPIDPFNSAFASVNAGGKGTVTVEKTDENTIKVTADGVDVTAEYISLNTVLTDGGGGIMSIPITQTTTIERLTYRDKNKTTGDLTVTVLTKTTVETKKPDGTVTSTEVSYTKAVTVTDKNGEQIKATSEEITDLKKFVPDTVDPEGTNQAQSGAKLIDIAFAYGQSVDLKISYQYIPATQTTDAEGNVTTTQATYLITILNPGEDAVSVKAILTEAGVKSGLAFIITDGTTETTLDATQDPQKVTIAGKTATNEPTDTPTDEPTDEPTE